MTVAAPRAHAMHAPVAALERAATLVLRVLDVPLAALTLAGAERPLLVGAAGEAWRGRREAPLSRSLCRHVAATGLPLAIDDARDHPLVQEDPLLWLGEAAYLGAPVRTADGVVHGVLCAIDSHPRPWTHGEVEAIRDLALLAAVALERPEADERGQVAGFVGAILGSRGRLSLRMLEKAVETMQLGVTITDTEGRILYTNPAEARMHGYTVEELRGQHARVFAPPENHRGLDAEAMEEAASWTRETVNVRKDGTVFPVLLRSDVVKDSRGRPAGIVTCCEDLTQRKALERRLLHNAFYDQLTGLPNRGLFTHRLDMAVERALRGEGRFAVLMVGLDRFKRVNDGLGREAGDELLVKVAERLRVCIRPDSMLSRLAGDEFAVLLDEIDGLGDAVRVAGCIQDALEQPFEVSAGEVFTGASVGIALSQSGYSRSEEVLRDAAIAMYRSKDAFRGQYQVFDLDMHAEAMARLRLETDLRRALERGELLVHYQPIVSLADGRISGFEALARWQHPERGMVYPDEFIPLAEDTGLILPLGVYVLEEACRALAEWQRRPGCERLTMAVNLSPRQISEPALVERVARVLRETGIARGTLKVEITEGVILRHDESVLGTLRALRALGVKLHVDDFGTGYSSLSYLHRLPFDGLKIDRSFVGKGAGADGLQLVRTILALAQALGVTVVTEGIETEDVLAELRALRCEFGQGYLFAHPVAVPEIDALLTADPRW